MTAFREALFAYDLIQFKLASGQVLTRLTRNITRPPSVALAWRVLDDDNWNEDLGGVWLETGEGKMIWKERTC